MKPTEPTTGDRRPHLCRARLPSGRARRSPVHRERVLRRRDWVLPAPPIRREQVQALPADPDPSRPPLLFVHGAAMGAWIWQERWLPAAADAGWASYAVSLRGHGGSQAPERFATTPLRHYEHDVLQAITELPAPPVLIGHALGAAVVLRVLERYRAAPAGVLLAPPDLRGGASVLLPLLRHEPASVLATITGRSPTPSTSTLFGPSIDEHDAASVRARLGSVSLRAGIDLTVPRGVPDIRRPLLVIGGEHDPAIPPWSVARTARVLGTRARLMRGMGHSLMIEPGWDHVLAQMLAWLDEHARPTSPGS